MAVSLSCKRVGLLKDLIVGVIFCLTIFRSFYSEQSVLRANSLAVEKQEYSSFQVPNVEKRGSTTSLKIEEPIPLHVLVDTNKTIQCVEDLIPMQDRILSSSSSVASRRMIPKIVHMTSKSRCLTKAFTDNIQKWHFSDHSFYFHDDEAVDRLLNKHFESFPHISTARKCLRSGAATADLWRYLVLWEYGGIYTDIDNAPGRLWNTTTIGENDDSFFLVEKLGVLSQYFMAASPRHPLLYLAIHNALHRLLQVENVGRQYIPSVTGPGALKTAFMSFMRAQAKKKGHPAATNNNTNNGYGRVQAGRYVGVDGRSVTVKGTKFDSDKIVKRACVPEKGESYKKMKIRHFSEIAKKKFNESCFVHIYNLEYGREKVDLTQW
jgi:mannosyltransferase OCH1-like enzyme